MQNSLLQELGEAKEWGEDLAPILARMDCCCWDHDVASCEVCRRDGVLSAQECMFQVYNQGICS